MEYYYMTDTGKVRDHNEDSVVITENMNKEILLTVADGMGGHNAGEVASSIAVTNIGKRFRELSTVGNKEDAINWLKETVNETNILIKSYTRREMVWNWRKACSKNYMRLWIGHLLRGLSIQI